MEFPESTTTPLRCVYPISGLNNANSGKKTGLTSSRVKIERLMDDPPPEDLMEYDAWYRVCEGLVALAEDTYG